MINTKGEVVIPLEHSILGDYFSEGLIEVSKDDAYGFLDKENNIIIEPKFGYVLPFFEGLAGFKCNDNKWGFINKKGSIVIEPT